jgi:hypothetical protein
VIGCCDSRVDPTMLMELGPGEVFTLRNVANLVPPWEKEGTYHGTSAALEFAVMGLQVEHIIVLGHTHCGGIRALMTRSDFNRCLFFFNVHGMKKLRFIGSFLIQLPSPRSRWFWSHLCQQYNQTFSPLNCTP